MAALLVNKSVTIYAIVVEGILRNNSVKIILNLCQWFRSRYYLKDFLSGALAALLFGGAVPLMQF